MTGTGIFVLAESFIFDLRVARRLLREHHTMIGADAQSDAALTIVEEIIDRIEDGAHLLTPPPWPASAEA